MKIAQISMFYHPTFGGVEQVMYELAQRQVRDGHEVHVFCCDSDKYKRLKKKEEIIGGVHVHRISYWLRLSLNTFIWPTLFLRLLFFKEKFDVVHTHVSGHDYILSTGIVSKIRGFKHVHTTHCPWTDTSFRPKILRPFIFLNDLFFNKFSFKFVDKIFSITPWEVETLKKYGGDGKIKVIPNGMDEVLYKKVKKNNFRERYGFKEKYLVLFFGRLNPTKGPEHLAQAAVNISKKRKDVAFVWVGPDEGKAEEVKKIIKGHKNMKYIGPLRGTEKVAEMYQAADIYALPSYREGLPLTLFEAMASGLPIVASPVNGIPYEMKEPDNGLFVEYGNVELIEEKILELLNDSKLRKKISVKNMKKAQGYRWEDIYQKYMKEYGIVLKEAQ